MKKIIVPIICLVLLTITFIYLNPITDTLAAFISNSPDVVIKKSNTYTKDIDYLFVQRTDDFIPYSYQDLLNIYYSVINNGWDEFTFYCPKEYSDCLDDVSNISGDDLILTHLNNYVHPFNSFTNIRTSINTNGEITLRINYLYTDDEIIEIDKEVDRILSEIINDNMDNKNQLKTIHDYIINNTRYDTTRNEYEDSEYESNTAFGPLFQGYATCNGYTDLMAIFLTKLGYNNYKIATTPEDLGDESATGHIWNAVFFDGEWLHIDLTWDDPVPDPNVSEQTDFLLDTYFLVTTEEMYEEDTSGEVLIKHTFNPLYYLEFN